MVETYVLKRTLFTKWNPQKCNFICSRPQVKLINSTRHNIRNSSNMTYMIKLDCEWIFLPQRCINYLRHHKTLNVIL